MALIGFLDGAAHGGVLLLNVLGGAYLRFAQFFTQALDIAYKILLALFQRRQTVLQLGGLAAQVGLDRRRQVRANETELRVLVLQPLVFGTIDGDLFSTAHARLLLESCSMLIIF